MIRANSQTPAQGHLFFDLLSIRKNWESFFQYLKLSKVAEFDVDMIAIKLG